MASIKQIKVGTNTYDVEPKNSEVLASTHITDALGYTPLGTADIINNLTSTASDKVLSAAQGSVLDNRIKNIEGRGRFLSTWNATTGKPSDLPGGGSSVTELYEYKTGDYFIVNTAGSKVPTGTSIAVGTTIETFPSADGSSSKANDTIIYSGSGTWTVLATPVTDVAWGTITGTLSSQTDLQTALDAKVDAAASSTDNAIARFDGTTGKIIQDSSGVTINDSGELYLNGGSIYLQDNGTTKLKLKYDGSIMGMATSNSISATGSLGLYGATGVGLSSGQNVTISSGSSSYTTKIDNITVPKGTTGKTFATTDQIPSVTNFVTGAASSTDNAIARFDGTTGKVIQNSGVTINDTGNELTVPTYQGNNATVYLGGSNFYVSGGLGQTTVYSAADAAVTANNGAVSITSGIGNLTLTANTSGNIKMISTKMSTEQVKSYLQTPLDDGSTSSNYYTIATREWVNSQPISNATNLSNGTGTGSLKQLYENATFTGIDINGTDTSYTSDAIGNYSITLGPKSRTTDKGGFTQGTKTVAAKYGIALGDTTYANDFGIAHGYKSIAGGYYSVALGEQSKTIGDYAVAQGYKTQADDYAHSEGAETTAAGQSSHAEGTLTTATGGASHAEGYSTSAVGAFSHSEGVSTSTGEPAGSGWVDLISTSPVTKTINTTGTITVTSASVSSGFAISTSVDNTNKIITATVTPTPTSDNKALIQVVYAIDGVEPEPGPTPTPTVVDPNLGAHSEGYGTKAYLTASHAEGTLTSAMGEGSHAEGYMTSAFDKFSHAEGVSTKATYLGSHAEGLGTETGAQYQTVVGKYNIVDSSSLFVVGGGTASNKATYFKVRTDGCSEVAADPVYNNDVVTKRWATNFVNTGGNKGPLTSVQQFSSGKLYHVVLHDWISVPSGMVATDSYIKFSSYKGLITSATKVSGTTPLVANSIGYDSSTGQFILSTSSSTYYRVDDSSSTFIETDFYFVFNGVIGNESNLEKLLPYIYAVDDGINIVHKDGDAIKGRVIIGSEEDPSASTYPPDGVLNITYGTAVDDGMQLVGGIGSGRISAPWAVYIGPTMDYDMFQVGQEGIKGNSGDFPISFTSTGVLSSISLVNSGGTGVNLSTTNAGGASIIQLKFWKGTQSQYDSISTKDSNTFYIIVG